MIYTTECIVPVNSQRPPEYSLVYSNCSEIWYQWLTWVKCVKLPENGRLLIDYRK